MLLSCKRYDGRIKSGVTDEQNNRHQVPKSCNNTNNFQSEKSHSIINQKERDDKLRVHFALYFPYTVVVSCVF